MPLKVLFVSSEVAPFRKTGGLADVAGALPKALARRGIDVRVVMPLYQGMRWHDLERLDGVAGGADVLRDRPGGGAAGHPARQRRCRVYLLEHHQYYDRPFVYGPPGQGYSDNLERFVFLSRASLELTKALGWMPDVAHANDWQTALVPVYLNTVEWGKPLHGTASVFTLHNLAYQGNQGGGRALHHRARLGALQPLRVRALRGLQPPQGRPRAQLDAVDREPDLRPGDPDLRSSASASTACWPRAAPTCAGSSTASTSTPGTRRAIPTCRPASIATAWPSKAACKAALQREMGLPERPDVPLFGVISRLTPQKGLDILAFSLERLLAWDLQIVVLGSGDPEAERFFSSMTARRGDKLRSFIGFDDGLSHRIEAGADFFLMPSRFEPCGLNQMYSLRYGTLPIVRATGGLADTVQTYDERTGGGTGFVFSDLNPDSLANTVGWALSTFHDRPAAHRADAPAGHGAGLLLGACRGGVRGPVPRGLPAPPQASLHRSPPADNRATVRFQTLSAPGMARPIMRPQSAPERRLDAL